MHSSSPGRSLHIKPGIIRNEVETSGFIQAPDGDDSSHRILTARDHVKLAEQSTDSARSQRLCPPEDVDKPVTTTLSDGTPRVYLQG